MTLEHFADLTVTRPELAIRFLISLGKVTDDRDLKNLIREIKKAMQASKGFFK